MDHSQTLAIFDLDNTLIAGDSDHAWGEFLIAQGLVDAGEHRRLNDAFYADYLRGSLDIDAYLRFALRAIAGKTPAELTGLQQTFIQQIIEPMRLPKAEALIQQHRDKGDHLLIITATNEFVTRPIADLLGIDDLLACGAEIIDGRYTGAPSGTPCFQHGKVLRLQEWLTERPFDRETTVFYSDSHNDIPLLEYVGQAVVVDGDEQLLAHASKQQWQAISLRN